MYTRGVANDIRGLFVDINREVETIAKLQHNLANRMAGELTTLVQKFDYDEFEEFINDPANGLTEDERNLVVNVFLTEHDNVIAIAVPEDGDECPEGVFGLFGSASFPGE